jgi:hypothetical protein
MEEIGACTLTRFPDPRKHPLRRMSLFAGILYQEPMAHNGAITTLRPATRNSVLDGAARRQGRRACGEDCE